MLRRDADKRSNLTNASKKPEWAVKTGTENIAVGTSIFDPVLCEVCYTWFCPPGGFILDPFAGGSVRGIVAAYLGYNYIGIDLSQIQVDANQQQAQDILSDKKPSWVIGNSLHLDRLIEQEQTFDFIFSCPPYFDLEIYSDNKEDLSTLSWDNFCQQYQTIILKCLERLKEDRFACFIVSDIRDKKGFYRKFPEKTIECFESSLHVFLYNSVSIINASGSLPIRVGKQFGSYRKVGRMHQRGLVFFKGNPKSIKTNFPQIEYDTKELLMNCPDSNII